MLVRNKLTDLVIEIPLSGDRQTRRLDGEWFARWQRQLDSFLQERVGSFRSAACCLGIDSSIVGEPKMLELQDAIKFLEGP